MTYEQTREQFLLAWNSNAYLNMCESDDMHNAIVALEKQIPKKPINEGYYYLCPCCRGDLGVSDDDIFIYELSMPKYCSNCGCVLDWTEVDYWLRQGYSLEDTNELIKTSTVLSEIGLIDSAEATQYLTSAISGLAEGMSNAAKLGTSCDVEVDGGD